MNESRLTVKLTYSSVDSILHEYSKNFDLILNEESVCFRYIEDYVKTGKWIEELPNCVPVTLQIGGTNINSLTRARWYYHEILVRNVIWEIAKRCEVDCDFATLILDAAAIEAKSCDDHEKKEWSNAKRRLREHKKKGKSLFGDYCYFVGHFNLYAIVDFEYML